MDQFSRTTAWAETRSGKKVSIPVTEDMICIGDIDWALSNQCRYAGHTIVFYSVAEHSCHIADKVWQRTKNARQALTALMHDAPEFILVDVPRPIKPHLTNYLDLEEQVARVIAKKFDLIYPLPSLIKEYDCRILNDERAALFDSSENDWELPYTERLGVKIMAWSPFQARTQFMERFNRYVGQLSSFDNERNWN